MKNLFKTLVIAGIGAGAGAFAVKFYKDMKDQELADLKDEFMSGEIEHSFACVNLIDDDLVRATYSMNFLNYAANVLSAMDEDEFNFELEKFTEFCDNLSETVNDMYSKDDTDSDEGEEDTEDEDYDEISNLPDEIGTNETVEEVFPEEFDLVDTTDVEETDEKETIDPENKIDVDRSTSDENASDDTADQSEENDEEEDEKVPTFTEVLDQCRDANGDLVLDLLEDRGTNINACIAAINDILAALVKEYDKDQNSVEMEVLKSYAYDLVLLRVYRTKNKKLLKAYHNIGREEMRQTYSKENYNLRKIASAASNGVTLKALQNTNTVKEIFNGIVEEIGYSPAEIEYAKKKERGEVDADNSIQELIDSGMVQGKPSYYADEDQKTMGESVTETPEIVQEENKEVNYAEELIDPLVYKYGKRHKDRLMQMVYQLVDEKDEVTKKKYFDVLKNLRDSDPENGSLKLSEVIAKYFAEV